MKPLILFHASCSDGFCAAWLFWRSGFYPDAEYQPVQYGTEPPDCTGRDVYILDFSYKRPAMRRILSQAHWVVTLDHHRTAEAELAGIVDEFVLRPDLIANPPGSELPIVHFDMTKSGARLAWEYLWRTHMLSANKDFGMASVCPWLVDYTEDRDLWRWKLPLSREINAALRSRPLDFAEWDDLAWCHPQPTRGSLVQEGRAILRRDQQIIDDHLKHAREVEIAGHRVLCVNATVLFSEIAGELAKDRPFGACYFDRADGKRQWSLRSRESGIDVSEVARSFGGGGHRNAAGYETEAPSGREGP